MFSLHEDGDMNGLVTLDQWTNFWEHIAAEQRDSVVQRELAKLKAGLRAKVAPVIPVKKVKSGTPAVLKVKDRGLHKLAL